VSHFFVMATLWNRAGHYIFALWRLLVFPRLILAVTEWMSTILPHMVWTLPSNRHHRSNGDSLEGKSENYQVCSVQYCVQHVHSAMHTHTNRRNSSLDWVLSHWVHFTVCRFIFVYALFCVHCMCV